MIVRCFDKTRIKKLKAFLDLSLTYGNMPWTLCSKKKCFSVFVWDKNTCLATHADWHLSKRMFSYKYKVHIKSAYLTNKQN